jgi:DNA-binding MarR family transcriptional regulator
MDEARLVNLLGALALRLVDGLHHEAFATLGYGGESAAALVTLGVEPGFSINDLRQALQLSHPGTVRLVDRLAQQGWVERRPGSDGRTVALFLTDAGHAKRHQLLAARRNQLQGAMQALTSEECAQLTPLLEKMLVAMTTSAAAAFAICRLCEEEVCPGDRCPVEQTYCQLANLPQKP